MGGYVAAQLIKPMLPSGAVHVVGREVLVMGLTFKENCPDLRNTRVVDIVTELREYGGEVDVYDPWVRRKMRATSTASTRSSSPQRVSTTPSSSPWRTSTLPTWGHGGDPLVGQGRRRFSITKYVFPAESSDLRL